MGLPALISNELSYNIHGVLNLSAGLFNASLGCIVLFQNPRSKVNRSFFLISVSAFIWVVGFGLMSLATSESHAYRWASLAYVGIPFISPTVYAFSCRWLDEENRLISISIAAAAVLAIPPLLWPEHLFDFTTHWWGRYIHLWSTVEARGYYAALISFFSVFSILAMRNFYRGIRNATDPIMRVQSRNILIGFIVAYVGSLDFAVKLGLKVYPSGCVCLSGLILVMAYTVLRHRVFEINLAIKRMSLLVLIYSALIALSLPITIPALRPFISKLTAQEAALLCAATLLIAFFIAAAPAIYAYLLGNQFILGQNATQGFMHELRSPLSAIQSAMEVLRQDNSIGIRSSPYLLMIERNAERLDAYVRDLLHLVKVQNGRLPLQPTTADISEILRETHRSYSPVADAKGVLLEVAETPSLQLDVDYAGIAQVLSNLTSNAIKFSDRGTVRIRAERNGRFVSVSVSDEGRGIDAADLERIFDRFVQVDHHRGGSGLGLAIAKGWVEAHGGRIWAESEGEGKGTKVTFLLPMACAR